MTDKWVFYIYFSNAGPTNAINSMQYARNEASVQLDKSRTHDLHTLIRVLSDVCVCVYLFLSVWHKSGQVNMSKNWLEYVIARHDDDMNSWSEEIFVGSGVHNGECPAFRFDVSPLTELSKSRSLSICFSQSIYSDLVLFECCVKFASGRSKEIARYC